MESNEARKCFSMKWIRNMRARNRLSFFLMSCFPHRHKCYLQLPQCSSDTHSFLYDKTLCDLVVRCVCIKATITKWMKREEKKMKMKKQTISRLVVGRIRSFSFVACDQRWILFIWTNVQSATMFSFFFLHWFTIFLLCSLLLYRRVCHSAGCIFYGTNLHTAKLNTVIRCMLRQETLRSNWWPSDSAV